MSARIGRPDATARSARRAAMEMRRYRWAVANATATDMATWNSVRAINKLACVFVVTIPRVTNANAANVAIMAIRVTVGCVITAACREAC